MKHPIARRHFLCTLAALPLAAAEFWNEKRYSQWDEHEVEQMLNDSPWAKRVPAGKGREVTVRWLSAAPVQSALARHDQGALSVPSTPRVYRAYVISVSGLPASLAPDDVQKLRDSLETNSALRVPQRAALLPDKVGIEATGQSLEIQFEFPNDNPIGPEHKTIEFLTRIGTAIVRCKFRTAEMMFNGKLAL